MIQVQLKLKLTVAQERKLEGWLFNLTGLWNWAIRKIELDANDGIYYSEYDFMGFLKNHSVRMDIPYTVLAEMARTAHRSWKRCFMKISGKPKLKGNRNKLNSIPFRFSNIFINELKFHKQRIPKGKVKCGRIIKRASGWYLCLTIAAEPKKIGRTGFNKIGIDGGFKSLLTTSSGEIVDYPRELELSARRLAQAQRGKNIKLALRIHERIRNQRKDRNHKLSRRLVAQNIFIAFSKDKHSSIARRFGKSVASSGHYQLRSMLAYKSRIGGTQYVETDSKYSTMTCADCKGRTGPAGLRGLAVRQWRCTSCGSLHDRDINAARNTLIAGLGMSLESAKCTSEIPKTRNVQITRWGHLSV
jgi:transposase